MDNIKQLKEVFIAHQYKDKSHFLALYEELHNYGYEIRDYIVLSRIFLIKRLIKSMIRKESIKNVLKEFVIDYFKIFKLYKLKNEIIIVGIAPYDYLLNKYSKVFKNNKCIYFTSWQYWDGIHFPKGKVKNKSSFENILKNYFQGVACVSNETSRWINGWFNFSTVVNHSLKVGEYKVKQCFKHNNLVRYIFLGEFVPRKNIQLIKEWLLKNMDLDLEFYFAGDGKLKNQVLALCRDDNRVKYLGKLSKNQIKNQLKEYDYLVLPTKEEPFGIVLLEALSSGIPCIVSDTLGPKEIINDNKTGFIFSNDNYNDFDRVMKKALSLDDIQYGKMSKLCLEASKKYDTKSIVNAWIKLLDDISFDANN